MTELTMNRARLVTIAIVVLIAGSACQAWASELLGRGRNTFLIWAWFIIVGPVLILSLRSAKNGRPEIESGAGLVQVIGQSRVHLFLLLAGVTLCGFALSEILVLANPIRIVLSAIGYTAFGVALAICVRLFGILKRHP
jgi:hypothetical protein